MRKYKTFKKQEDSFNKVSNWILIIMLMVLGYFIAIIDSKADDLVPELVPTISYFDENSLTIYMSDNHTITIDLEEGETAEDYIIIYYIQDNRFIKFTDKFFDYLINSNDERLYQYYYFLKNTSYLLN
jgi:hypothetical protein